MVGELMSCRLLLFPRLQELSINETDAKNIVHPVAFISPRNECLAAEEVLLGKAAELRTSLTQVTYGLHKWTRLTGCWPPKWQLQTAQIWGAGHIFGISRPVAILYRLGHHGAIIPWTQYISMNEETIPPLDT